MPFRGFRRCILRRLRFLIGFPFTFGFLPLSASVTPTRLVQCQLCSVSVTVSVSQIQKYTHVTFIHATKSVLCKPKLVLTDLCLCEWVSAVPVGGNVFVKISRQHHDRDHHHLQYLDLNMTVVCSLLALPPTITKLSQD